MHAKRGQCARITFNRSIRDLKNNQMLHPQLLRYVAHIANPLFVLMRKNILNI